MKAKNYLVSLMLAATLTVLPVGLTACGGDSDSTSSSSQELTFESVGEYYCSTDTSENADQTTVSVTPTEVTLKINGATLTGGYTYDGTKVTATFSDGQTAEFTVEGTTLQLKYANAEYTFYKKVNYTVTFNTNGGSEVAAATVLNGRAATKPADPTKENYWFVGWYADEALQTLYDFDTAIKDNVTLYARFVEKTEAAEFTVNFVVDGQDAFSSVQTKGGVVYNTELPTPEKEGATFAGWWVSDYADGTKLTYKYNENKLGENTTLYAVWEESDKLNVSVTPTGITWNSIPGNTLPYNVFVYDANDQIAYSTVIPGETSCALDFSKRPAGEYRVEVSVGTTISTTAYYKNKQLNKITHFNVSEGRLLTFNEIANATKYLITVDCGDDTHVHTQVEVTSPAYDFSACAMQEEGIIFTVQAVADGYTASTPVQYEFEANLAEVTGLNVDSATEIATWNAVENATGYVVEIFDDGASRGKNTITETSVSLRGLTGVLEVKVYPISRAYNSSAVQTVTFNNARLAVPMGLKLSGHSVVWDAVDNATGYKITIGNKEYTVSTNEFALDDIHFTNNVSEIYVQATCADAAKTSLKSDMYTVRADNKMADTLVYSNGTVSWDAVLGATKYGVVVGGGEEFFVEDANQATVAFAQKGDVTVKVRCYNAQNAVSDWVSTTVKVYQVSFNVSGGSSVGALYKAEGDSFSVDTYATSLSGYTFAGWYNASGLNGEKYEGTLTQGASDLTIYAKWTANKYTVTLNAGELGVLDAQEATQEREYGSSYILPTPECKDTTKVFAGWRLEPNNQGTQYTKADGTSIGPWLQADNELVLYASWLELFTFDEVKENDVLIGYAVKASYGVELVSELTIPATYKDLPVVRIDNLAFGGEQGIACASLKVINIPTSIKDIFLSADGAYASTSAFSGCSNLERITVYGEVTEDTVFISDNGSLIKNNTQTGQVELFYVPKAKGKSAEVEEYYVSEKVTAIPYGTFYQSRLKKIVVPASVVQIDVGAFKNSSYLQEIEFLASTDGEEKALNIAEGAFEGCTSITEIALPARIQSITALLLDDLKNLTNVEIVGNAVDGVMPYKALGGVVGKGNVLIYYPRAKEGFYTIHTDFTEIADYAFNGASKLTGVKIHEAVTSIGMYAFSKCSGITSVTFMGTADSSALTIDKYAFYDCSNITELTLPANLAKLEEYAFGYNRNLTKVYLQIGETAVLSDNVFMKTDGTSYVEALYIGANVKDVAIASVFGNKLVSVEVSPDNQNYASEEGVLFDKDITEIVYFPANKTDPYTIPDTVVVIGARVFESKKITAVTIPATTTTIGDYAFYNCTALTTVTIKSAENTAQEVALTIGSYAFEHCSVLNNVEIPARVISIGDYAYANNAGLTSITIEGDALMFTNGATNALTIGEYAFASYSKAYGNTQAQTPTLKLATITLPTRLDEIGAYAFSNSALTSVNIPEGVEEIGDYAFESSKKLVSITLPTTLTKLGAYTSAGAISSMNVFSNCSALTSVTVTDGNENFATKNGVLYVVSDNVFTELLFNPIKNAGTDGKVVIASTVTKIWKDAFKNNSGITEITFDGDVASTINIGTDVFNGCTTLQKIELPNGITTISANMFKECDALETVSIPWTVKSMESKAFYGCGKLKEVIFAETPPEEKENEEALTFAACNSSSGIFYNCSKLEKLILPERTSTIGKFAFYGLKIKEAYIPASVSSLGESAFANCYSLAKLTFGLEDSALTAIPKNAFQNCRALTTVVLPDSITSIADNAFQTGSAYSAGGITSLTLPANLQTIGKNAFQYAQIKTLTFGEKLTTISNYAFADCAVESIDFSKATALTTIGANAFDSCKSLTGVSIPASVTSIGADAFNACTALTALDFVSTDENQSKLASIGDHAFRRTAIEEVRFPESSSTITLGEGLFAGCTNLTDVHLSKSVTNVQDVFQNCPSLDWIEVADQHPNFSTKEGEKILYNANGNGIRYIYGSIVGVLDLATKVNEGTMEGIVELGDYAFENQSLMTSIILPYTLQSIGNYAFAGCNRLANVTFLSKDGEAYQLKSIGDYAFAGTPIRSIALPENVTEIGINAFADCAYLETATLNSKLSEIGDYAFSGALKLSAVTIPEGITSIGNYMFKGTALTSVKIPASVKSIGTSAFEGCAELAQVDFAALKDTTLTSELTEIGANAFKNAAKLTSFPYPNTVTKFGNYALSGTALTSFTFHNTTTSIGTHMFYNVKTLSSVTLPSGIESIPNYMFYNTAFTSFDVPSTVTSIGTNAFENCASLQSVTLPSSLETLGASAFKGCVKLASATFAADPTSLTTINASTFMNDALLTKFGYYSSEDEKYHFPSKLTTIGKQAFSGAAFSTVVIPETVTKLLDQAFENNKALTTVTFGGKLTTVNSSTGFGAKVFMGCTALNSVTIRANTKALGNYLFGNSEDTVSPVLTSLSLPSTLTTLGEGVFTYSNIATIDLSSTSVTAVPVKGFQYAKTTTVKLPTKCTEIKNYAFQGAAVTELDLSKVAKFPTSKGYAAFQDSALTKVTLNSKITAGKFEFYNAKSLQTVELGTSFDLGLTTASSSGNHINMFQNCTALKTIKLTDKVTILPYYFFDGCTSLTTVENLSKVKTLGNYVFKNTAIQTADLSSATAIGASSFQGCTSLKSVTLNNSLTALNNDLFNGCTALQTINLPTSLQTIGNNVFQYCSSLTSTSISALPSTVTSIGTYAFRGTGLTSIDLSAATGLTILGGTSKSTSSNAYTFADCTKLETVKLPTSLQYIPGYAFMNCTALKDISIPASVILIGNEAFANAGLTSITLPKSLESLGNSVFAGSSVTSYTIDPECAAFWTLQGSLYTSDGLLIAFSKNMISDGVLTFPESCTGFAGSSSDGNIFNNAGIKEIVLSGAMTTLPKYAFNGLDTLERITIPATITSIEQYAFQKCTNLREVIFEDGDTELKLGNMIFYYCSSLENVVLSSRIKTIGSSMFGGTSIVACSSLTSITLPEGLEEIGSNAFAYVPLTSITFPSTLKTVGNKAFAYTNISSVAFNNVETLGEGAFQGSKLAAVNFTDKLTSVGGAAFAETLITSVNVPLSVTSWSTSSSGGGAFQDCTLLSSVTIPEGMEIIPASMFAGCTALESVTLPQSLTYISNGAFKGTGLKSIVIPDGVLSLGATQEYEEYTIETSGYNYAFQNCTSLTSVTLPKNLKEIGAGVFNGCTALTEITIPESVGFIGGQVGSFENSGIKSLTIKNPNITLYYAFQNMKKLEEVKLPDGMKYLGVKVFNGCTSLKEITLPASLVNLETVYLSNNGSWTEASGGGQFSYTALQKIVIPNGVTEIPKEAFSNCTSLVEVVIGDGVESIGQSAFYGCTSLSKVTVGLLVETFGNTSVFYNCDKLVEIYNRSLYITVEAGSSDYGYLGYNARNIYTDQLGETMMTVENGFYVLTEGTDKTLVNYVGTEKNVVVPEGITVIAKNAFKGNKNLYTIVLPDTLTTIEQNAFEDCYNLYKVTLGTNVKTIEGAFTTCYKLIEVYNKSALELEIGAITNGSVAKYAKNVYTPTEGASKLSIVNDCVIYTDGEDKIFVAYVGSSGEVVLPAGVTEIIAYAFYGGSVSATANDWLVSIKASDNALKVIGAYAFQYCTVLESVELGNGIQSIGTCAFRYDYAVSSYTIGENVTEVGANAFGSWAKTQTVYVVATQEAVEAYEWVSTWSGSATVVYDCLNVDAEE